MSEIIEIGSNVEKKIKDQLFVAYKKALKSSDKHVVFEIDGKEVHIFIDLNESNIKVIEEKQVVNDEGPVVDISKSIKNKSGELLNLFKKRKRYLILKNGNKDILPKKFLLEPKKGKITIGKGPSSNIYLADHNLSSTHAEIFFEDDKIYIREEENIINLVLINGKKIAGKQEIMTGDKIKIGGSEFELV